MLPVINENDTTTTDEISFGDNDFLAAQVAMLIGADLLVLLTDVEGLFTASPRTDPGGRARADRDGLRRARRAVDRPHDVAAGHGRDALEGRRRRDGDGGRDRDGHLQRAARGRAGRRPDGDDAGTRFSAGEARYSSFKLWLKYAKPSRGTVVVDAGAARALRDGGTSLLPVGITEVRGAFDAGDAVQVAHGAIVIGKGICNYAADELGKVKGLKSAAVREVMPRATDEAIHRDYFVLS